MQATAELIHEETLMADYVEGNDQAFRELFRVLGPRIKNFFMRKFGDESLADDMQQITFMKMHRAKTAYRVGEPVRPWLFTIAARVRIDELRKQRSQQGCSDDLELADLQVAENHVDPVERADLAKRVRAALAALPESQRRVVKMHRYEGMTFKEIASALDTTEAAVKLRAFRAYGQLRKQLAVLVEA